jgi:two-component system, cell cycle response regulator
MGGKILIVDDVATNRIVMKVKLSAAGYVPVVAATAAACLELALSETPDLILLDYILPDQSGTDVVTKLRANPVTRAIPIIMFSASHSPDARIAAFQVGADDFLLKPLDDQILLARIRSLLRARDAVAGLAHGVPTLPGFELAEAQALFALPGTVAIVVAKPEIALHLRRNLTTLSAQQITVMTPDEALTIGRHAPPPDVFVIDADLAIQGGGLRLMSDLRSGNSTRNASFAIYSAPDSQVSPAMVFDLGANDLFSPGTLPAEMALRLARLVARKREADHLRASVQDGLRMAVIDPLTGLHNRRYGLARLQAISDRAREAGSKFAVLVVDIDRFKQVNDLYGHAAGDTVLAEVAQRLRDNLRAGDLVARIGGEEFLIALPEIALPEARTIAERLCAMMQDKEFTLETGQSLHVTLSIGLAISEGGATPQQCDTVTEIFDRADRALLHSKSTGRNQVTVSRTAA